MTTIRAFFLQIGALFQFLKKGRGDLPPPPCSYVPPHEVEPANTSSSQENIVTNDIEREENITLQNHEISPEKNIIQSSIKKHVSHDTRANNSKRLEHKKSVIILGNSMTKLLNGWEMEKTIQCNCKIYVETFSGATTSCMEDYVKQSSRNPHRLFHFACWDERSILCKILYGNHQINNKSGPST